MSKKKRFRKKTLGRLSMFFKNNPYTGYVNSIVLSQNSIVLNFNTSFKPIATHYNKCYKKKNLPHQQHDSQV